MYVANATLMRIYTVYANKLDALALFLFMMLSVTILSFAVIDFE